MGEALRGLAAEDPAQRLAVVWPPTEESPAQESTEKQENHRSEEPTGPQDRPAVTELPKEEDSPKPAVQAVSDLDASPRPTKKIPSCLFVIAGLMFLFGLVVVGAVIVGTQKSAVKPTKRRKAPVVKEEPPAPAQRRGGCDRNTND